MERQRDGEIKDTFHDLTGNVCKRTVYLSGSGGRGGGGGGGGNALGYLQYLLPRTPINV